MKRLAVILLVMCSSAAMAQPVQAKIFVRARPTGATIGLRWAPDNPALWYYSLRYGYSIERVTLTVNGRIVPQDEVNISTQPILPATEKRWDAFMERDDYVATAAQMIFGESEARRSPSPQVEALSRSLELEQRFSMTLFAADHSLKAAELSGLYFEDTRASGGAKYLYKVYSNVPASLLVADTAYVTAGIDDITPLPAIRDLTATVREHKVTLDWDAIIATDWYNSFEIERSDDDGKSFEKIHQYPFVFATNNAIDLRRIYKTDSIADDNKKYCYRVRGMTAFAEGGPYSDTVCARFVPQLPAPVIKSLSHRDGMARISWEFPVMQEPVIRGFRLYQFEPGSGNLTLTRDSISSNVREVAEPISKSKYFVVKAVGAQGTTTQSLPHFLQVNDSVPPNPPSGLRGRIDYSGRVSLEWMTQDDDEIYGYHIYRSYDSTAFHCVSPYVVQELSFSDSVALKTLAEKIYYRVVALDHSFNTSAYSAVLILEKPDIVHPAPPAFHSVVTDSAQVTLRWHNSASSDVVKHVVYQRVHGSNYWKEVYECHKNDTPSFNNSIPHSTTDYTIVAVDDAGLESTPATPVTVSPSAQRPSVVDAIYCVLDNNERMIGINWEYPQSTAVDFLLYKSVNGSPLQLYRRLHASERMFIDHYKRQDKAIAYSIAVINQITGLRSGNSKSIIVKP